jgi:hypothetical protein
MIAADVTYDQAAAKPLFKFGEATLHGRLIDTKRFRRRQHAACASEGKKVLQIVPGEHPRTVQLCDLVSQYCGCPGAVEPG